MVVDPETADNPYSSPSTPATSSGRPRIVRWLLLCVAIFLVILSLPIAWGTLALANQEYLHIWTSRSAIYGLEMNGKPITIAEAIRNGTIAVLIQWALAAALILGPRLFMKKDTAR